MSEALPLVSILIPAYHERFFAEAFASARAQDYPAIEIVVGDDSAGEAIERCVREASDKRVRYLRNATRLGFQGNFTACFEQARGEYVKFLNDDDRLHPQNVAVLAMILRLNRGVTLATSRRYVIDAAGRRQPDVPATAPIACVPAFIPGTELGNYMLMNMINVVGEPSTPMFRAADLTRETGSIFRWGGEDYHCFADLSLWLRLLARGSAFYAPDALSEFRRHSGQEQESAQVLVDCLLERRRIARQARASGYLSGPGQYLAALGAGRAYLAPTDFARLPPDIAARVRRELDEVDAEIAGLGQPSARSAGG